MAKKPFKISKGSRKSLKMFNQLLISLPFLKLLEKDWFLLPCLKVYLDSLFFELLKLLYSLFSWHQNVFI